MKHCPHCDTFKPFSEFTKEKRRKHGLSVYCKVCAAEKRLLDRDRHNAYRAQKWKDDPDYREHYLKYHRARYIREKDKLQEYQKNHYSVPINKLKYLVTNAKSRAIKEGMEFNLDHTKIEIPTHCKYLGIELTYTHKQGRKRSNISLDRIDSTRGYTMDNIQLISDKANVMKNDASIPELVTFAKNVLKEHDNEM